MSYGRAPRGLSETFNKMFHRRPLVFPIALLALGFLFLTFAPVPALILLIFGAFALPLGVFMAIRRRTHPVVLHCPQCGTESSTTRAPFVIERPSYVDYAIVTCPRCGNQFTVDKYARLI